MTRHARIHRYNRRHFALTVGFLLSACGADDAATPMADAAADAGMQDANTDANTPLPDAGEHDDSGDITDNGWLIWLDNPFDTSLANPEIHAFSPDGARAVGHANRLAPTRQGFRWSRSDGATALPHPPEDAELPSEVAAMTDDGATVVGRIGTRSVMWTADNEVQVLDPSAFGFDVGAYVAGINGNAELLLFNTDGAVAWISGAGSVDQRINIVRHPQFACHAYRYAALGTAAALVCHDDQGQSRPAHGLVHDSSVTLIGTRAGTVRAISRDGTTVVGELQDNPPFDAATAFRWTAADGVRDLSGPQDDCYGRGADNTGRVVAGWCRESGPADGGAMLWIGDTTTRLLDVARDQGVLPATDTTTALGDVSAMSADGRTYSGSGIRGDTGRSATYVLRLATAP